MTTSNYNFDFREKYLRNELSSEEVDQYEEAMLDNPELKEELKQHIYLINLVGVALEEERVGETVEPESMVSTTLSERLANFLRGVFQGMMPVYQVYGRYLALMIVVVVGVGIWWWSREEEPSEIVDLYGYYYGKTRMEVSDKSLLGDGRDRGDRGSNELKIINPYEQFNHGSYQEARKAFLDTLKIKADENASFFLALSEMELNDFKIAQKHLENHLNTYNSYIKDAQWFLALVYLKLDKVSQSIKILTELSKEQSPYQEESLDLLNKLSNQKNSRHD